MDKLTKFLLLSVCLTMILVGCGGGNGSLGNGAAANATGRATFTITWPDRSRLIPDASNSIRVEVKNGAAIAASTLLSRPVQGGTSSVTFAVLPVGSLTMIATAYPQTDGSGTAQATATIPLVIAAGQDTPFSLTMASTIDHLELTPARVTLSIGSTQTIGVAAKDASGAVVLLSLNRGQWQSADTSVASVSTSGMVTGVAIGSTSVSYIDTESGKTASLPVTVARLTFNINGTNYVTGSPQETLTAVFAQSDGGVSVSSYSGYVLVHVIGVGQSDNYVYNDAFYRYTDHFANDPNRDFFFYQLAFGTSPIQVRDISANAINFLVGSLPAYDATHEYTIILNTGLVTPGQLHFGVSDGGFSDNTGEYRITVTQLVPGP